MWAALSPNAPLSTRRAFELFLRGDYDAALAALAFEALTLDRALVEAHVLHSLRRRADAAMVLHNALRATRTADTNEQVALAQIMRAAALSMSGDPDAARAILETWTAVTPDSPLRDESLYYRALCAYGLREYAYCELLLSELPEDIDPNVLARAEYLRGWLFAKDLDLAAQTRACLNALSILERLEGPDRGLMAFALQTTAALARDRLDAQAISTVERYANFQWTGNMALERFQVLRTIAWAHALRGEYERAIDELNIARAHAPSEHLRLLSHLDRAWIATISNEPLHLRTELREAERCIDTIDWDDSAGEKVGALVLFAELCAVVDTVRAERALKRARAMKIDDATGFARDERLRAFMLAAEAAIFASLGDRRRAAHRAEEAFGIFSRVGYRWRAANIALTIFRLLNRSTWLPAAAEVAEQFPYSFVAVEYLRLTTDGPTELETLTPRQREIVDLIRSDGLDNEGLARRLGRSVNTIRIHKRTIFRIFNVKNEFQLLSRLNAMDHAS